MTTELQYYKKLMVGLNILCNSFHELNGWFHLNGSIRAQMHWKLSVKNDF
jgi:hypothetical protein